MKRYLLDTNHVGFRSKSNHEMIADLRLPRYNSPGSLRHAERPIMADMQSGISKERLAKFLDSIRKIANLPDEAATVALDDLVATLVFESRYYDSDVKRVIESMDRFRTTISRVRAGSAIAGQQLLWDAQGLRQEAEQLDKYLDSGLKTKFKDEFAALRAEAQQAIKEAEYSGHAKILEEHAIRPIHNASSVKGIVSRIDLSLDALRKMGPVPDELVQTARRGKERAARYRAQKRLDEADVYGAGGNPDKADKLRSEAAAMLAQDWAQAFPEEQLPLPSK